MFSFHSQDVLRIVLTAFKCVNTSKCNRNCGVELLFLLLYTGVASGNLYMMMTVAHNVGVRGAV